MLPSKGYFLSINCPYYESGECERPHCHFKHCKIPKDKEEENLRKTLSNLQVELNENGAHNKENKENPKTQPNVDAKVNQSTVLSNLPEITKGIDVANTGGTRSDFYKRHIPVVYAPAKPTTTFRKELSNNSRCNKYIPVVPENCPKPLNFDYKPSTNKTNADSEYQPQSLSSNNCTVSYTPSQSNKTNLDAPVDSLSMLDSEEESIINNDLDQDESLECESGVVDSTVTDERNVNGSEEDNADKTILYNHSSKHLKNSTNEESKIVTKRKENKSSKHAKDRKETSDHKEDSKRRKCNSEEEKDKHTEKTCNVKGSKDAKEKKTDSNDSKNQDSMNNESKNAKTKEKKECTKHDKSHSRVKDESKISHKSSHKSKSKSESSHSHKEERAKSDSHSLKSSSSSSKCSDNKKKSSSKHDKSHKASSSKHKESSSSNSSSSKHKSSHSSKLFEQPNKHKVEKTKKKHSSDKKDESKPHKRSHSSSNGKDEEQHFEKKPKWEIESASSSDVESVAWEPNDIIISDSSDDEQLASKNEPVVNEPSKLNKKTTSRTPDYSTVLYERWMKARETIKKNPQGRMRIAHVPNVSSLLTAKDRILSISSQQKSMPEQPPSNPVEVCEPKIVKRVAHVPRAQVQKYPKVKPDADIKIPPVVRQVCLNNLYDEFCKFFSSEESSDKALAEELDIAKRMSVAHTYQCAVAVFILRIRKNKGVIEGGKNAEAIEPLSSESIPPYTYGLTIYDCCTKYLMTESELLLHGYPQKIEGKPGCAYFNIESGRAPIKQEGKERVCINCTRSYYLDDDDMPIMDGDCVYHWGRLIKVKVYGGWTEKYTCCNQEQFMGGCQTSQYHISNTFDWECLEGFVSTKPSKKITNDHYAGVYALDCEMCSTTKGSELTRVTVVDLNGNIKYDVIVRPDNPILDYCTRFSGITEEVMATAYLRLPDVQAQLLKIFNDKTILIGHSLENDLRALRMFHNRIIDTSVLYPHRKGHPYKYALKTLTKEYLGREIQIKDSGHDSEEDAQACLELVILKIKEDCKSRKPRVIISLPGKQTRKESTEK
ncbi:RNA exonuclease 1 homolog [Cimex lectularius]|uniref:Exonuclease domain-containing protein n=1 Tax=Cimex lectularius TaxID=79782 RepID=A0A8I6RTK9_CIMLE|nr:RNA exonuclease 1 homolog [Cimex lectularius]